MYFDNFNDILLSLSVVILILPLISFLLIIFNQKRLGRKAGWIGFSTLTLCLLLSAFVAFQKLVVYPDIGMIPWKFDWFSLGSSTINIGIGIDNLTAVMLIVVTLISSLVHLFSTEYMREDKRFPRFYAYLGLFTFSMLGIVLANNLLIMYIFWELVGVSSYLLIGFWYEKDSAANANKKAFITNRVGDFGMLIGILICFFAFGTFMFDEIFANIEAGFLPFDSATVLTVAGICLFMGAIGKSAQFPLHTWLPDAMEGPTPVSALIHAATMVAAGVYLTARIFPMLSADALVFVAYIGAITAFLAATIAITQNDFKRVLAYSTVSQLGFMIMAIGVGAMALGFMHLVTHAWFKACLFLASGSVIHAMHHSMHIKHDHHTDPQDIRNMGGLRKTMPLTYFCFLFACIAIAGVPLTSGFLSKDGILAGVLAFGSLSGHWFIPIAGFSAAFMTAFYMFRLCIEAFHGKPKTEIAKDTHENKAVIVFPLILLAGLSFWFFYSPNPTDASKGWFLSKIQTPASVVPSQYQFDFITDKNKVEYEYPCAVNIDYGNGFMLDAFNRDGLPWARENGVFRPATVEESHKLVNDFNMLTDYKGYQGKGLAVSKHGRIIVVDYSDMAIEKTPYTVEYADGITMTSERNSGLLFVFGEGGEENKRPATAEETQKFINDYNEFGGEQLAISNGKIIVENVNTVARHSALDAESPDIAGYPNKFAEELHNKHTPAMILSLLIAGCGILFAFVVYQWRKISADKVANSIKPLYNLSFNKWYIDEIYDRTVIGGTVALSKLLSFFDNKVVDGLVNFSATVMRGFSWFIGKFDNLVVDGFVNFTAWKVGFWGKFARKMQTGSVQTYIAFSIVILMIIAYFVV